MNELEFNSRYNNVVKEKEASWRKWSFGRVHAKRNAWRHGTAIGNESRINTEEMRQLRDVCVKTLGRNKNFVIHFPKANHDRDPCLKANHEK